MDVKALRLKLGYTQRELAQTIGVATETVNRWEHGRKPTMLAQYALERLDEQAAALAETLKSYVPGRPSR